MDQVINFFFSILNNTKKYKNHINICNLNYAGPKSKMFRDNIRTYNSMFSFTSMGGKVDDSINKKRGPKTFKLSGQKYHQIGSLLPPKDPLQNLHNYISMIQKMKCRIEFKL